MHRIQELPLQDIYGMEMSMQPPYIMTGVNLNVFPLRADPIRLSNFIDNYLNIVPPEVAYFRPMIPFVALVVGYTEEAGQAPESGGSQFGFLSQTNVMFAIPLLWYRQQGEKMVLHDFAVTMPIVYTSDWHSLLIMRAIFGWNTLWGWADAGVPVWSHNINASNPVFTLMTRQVKTGFRGERSQPTRLLQIEDSPNQSRYQVPPFSRHGNLFHMLGSAIDGKSSTASGLLSILRWWYQVQIVTSPLTSAPTTLDRLRPRFDQLKRLQPTENIISLKQVRDAEQQDQVAYQGLLCSRTTMTYFNRAGLLGNRFLPFTDPTGGYRIRVNRDSNQSMLDLLGIRVDHWHREIPPTETSEVRVTQNRFLNTDLRVLSEPTSDSPRFPRRSAAVLEPYYPFWVSGNFAYSEGEAVCWRLRDSPWMAPQPPRVPVGLDTSLGYYKFSRNPDHPNTYNTAAGPSILEYSGPYLFSSNNRVLPLPTEKSRLQVFIDQYLQLDAYNKQKHRFEPWGDHVFLSVADFQSTVSLTENVSNWARKQMAFIVPLKWFYTDADGEEYLGIAFCSPYSFTDSEVMAVTMSQIFGWTTQLADIESPDSVWMDAEGTDGGQPLARLWAYVNPSKRFPVYNERVVLTEILEGFFRKDGLPIDGIAGERNLAIGGPEQRTSTPKLDLPCIWEALATLSLQGRPISEISREFEKTARLLTPVLGEIFDLSEEETCKLLGIILKLTMPPQKILRELIEKILKLIAVPPSERPQEIDGIRCLLTPIFENEPNLKRILDRFLDLLTELFPQTSKEDSTGETSPDNLGTELSETPETMLHAPRIPSGIQGRIPKIPINLIAPKQVPGTRAQAGSVYQSLVLMQNSIDRLSSFGVLRTQCRPRKDGPEADLAVRFHYTPMLPLVENLGLITTYSRLQKSTFPNRVWQGGLAQTVRPEHPVAFQAKLSAGKAKNIAWRAVGSPQWQGSEGLEECMLGPLLAEPASRLLDCCPPIRILKFLTDCLDDNTYDSILTTAETENSQVSPTGTNNPPEIAKKPDAPQKASKGTKGLKKRKKVKGQKGKK